MQSLHAALTQREAEGRPIRIGLVGAGFMGRGIAVQLCTPLTGLRLVAIANRHIERAESAWSAAGVSDPLIVNTQSDLDRTIDAGRPTATDNPQLLCHAGNIDVIIDATSDIQFGARTALAAIAGRKHLVSLNAQLDATLGPILKVLADEAGIIITSADGDEPAMTLNLIRHAQSLGFRPVMCGNIKGFLDRYRTADTQRAFAEKTGLDPIMCAAYADGTKLNLEACLVANATGFTVAQRGMGGPRCDHVNDLIQNIVQHVSPQQLLEQPRVDYVLGAQPGSGVFVVAHNDEPAKRHYMEYLKMGPGPLYVFYDRFVLPHLQPPLTAARAVLQSEAAIAPLGASLCEVVTVAKRDLAAGETLDGLGGYAAYGLIENAEIVGRNNLLPFGLSSDCILRRDVRRDATLTYDDVEVPPGRLIDQLRDHQNRHFSRENQQNQPVPPA